jgi:hypothetical protein
VEAFAAAGHTDPARRPTPEALVRMLTAAPLECWTAPQEPAPIDEGTARGAPRPDRPTALRPAAPTVSPSATYDWVTPAVFRPRRRWRPATALVAGSLLGLAVAAGLALLWW